MRKNGKVRILREPPFDSAKGTLTCRRAMRLFVQNQYVAPSADLPIKSRSLGVRVAKTATVLRGLGLPSRRHVQCAFARRHPTGKIGENRIELRSR